MTKRRFALVDATWKAGEKGLQHGSRVMLLSGGRTLCSVFLSSKRCMWLQQSWLAVSWPALAAMQEEIKGPERSATATLSISDQTGAQQESVGLETRAAALWFLLITNPKFVNEVIHVVI